MSKIEMDKLDIQISKMSNEEWAVFANKVKLSLKIAKIKAKGKKTNPSSKDILLEL